MKTLEEVYQEAAGLAEILVEANLAWEQNRLHDLKTLLDRAAAGLGALHVQVLQIYRLLAGPEH